MNYFYGGAFNPMTKAHFQIINQIEKEMVKDDLLIIGITNHDYKKFEFSYELRRKIILENLKNNLSVNRINVKVVEQNQRTWKFLTEDYYISEIRPLTIVLGEDEFNDLKALNIWYYSKEILNTFPIKVFSRSEETKDISATKVRELLKQNVSFNELEKYISEITWNLIKNI